MTKKDSKRAKEKPKYTPPLVKTYTSKEIIEEIGPAQACTGASPGCTVSPSPGPSGDDLDAADRE